MSTTAQRRAEAVQVYEDLGLSVFPYSSAGLPFKDWPNPALAADENRRSLVLEPWVSTFGVLLDGLIVCIDVDADRGGRLEDLEAVFGPLPVTSAYSTPSSDGNRHLLFRVASGVPLRTSKALAAKFPGIDFLGLGSHIKGATSWRRLDREEDAVYSSASYNRLYPFIEPAELPADIEAAWRDTMVGSDQELQELELVDAETGLQPVKLSTRERRRVEKWVRESLQAITEAGDGERWDVLSVHMLAVYRNGLLLTGSTSAFDRKIIAAYKASGGTDLRWLESLMKPTKVFAAKHPKPRPAVSAFQATASVEVGAWADAAWLATGARDKQMREVIKAIAKEARSDLSMTTAASTLATRYNLGHEDRVQAAMRRLAEEGWLLKTGHGKTVRLNQQSGQPNRVNHYQLANRH